MKNNGNEVVQTCSILQKCVRGCKEVGKSIFRVEERAFDLYGFSTRKLTEGKKGVPAALFLRAD